MGPPGGGRNPITHRIMRHFNYLAFTELEDTSKAKIFSTIVNWWLRKFSLPFSLQCMEYEAESSRPTGDQRGRGERLCQKIAKHVI